MFDAVYDLSFWIGVEISFVVIAVTFFVYVVLSNWIEHKAEKVVIRKLKARGLWERDSDD